MTMSTNFDTNAADGIEIDSIFSSDVAYGTANDANNQRRNKKYGKVKSLVFVSTAVVAVIFGWTAFSGMNQPVQGNEMMERNLKTKSTKAPSVPATAAPVATSSPVAKSTKAPTVPATAAPVAKSTKAPTVPATAAPVATSSPVAKSTKAPKLFK